jgi:hypothetical protein
MKKKLLLILEILFSRFAQCVYLDNMKLKIFGVRQTMQNLIIGKANTSAKIENSHCPGSVQDKGG